MISQTSQRLVSAAILALAFGAMVLAVTYRDDTPVADPALLAPEDRPASAGATAADVPPSTLAPTAVEGTGGPIERFLPDAGQASACRGPVGVELASGFGARLTINGHEIAPEEMNVNLDEDGNVTNVLSASRSIGQYSFIPGDDCPNGGYIRPVDNVLDVCVYRVSDAAQSCSSTARYTFDAL